MSDEMTFTLNNPLTEEEWDMIADVDFDHTSEITFHTKHGKEVVFVKRKKGKWIHGRELSRELSLEITGEVVTAIFYEGWECSECHCLVSEEHEPLWKFCPNCGADMRGGK